MDEAVRRGALALLGIIGYAAVSLTYVKVAQPMPGVERWLLLFGVVPVGALAAVVAWALLRRRPSLEGAMLLDKHHNLHGRLANALAFARLPEAERSPFMQAAIDDAREVAPKLAPRRAAPLHFPRELAVSVGLGALVFGIAQLEVRHVRYEQHIDTFEPLVMAPDDLELFRGASQDLEGTTKDEETREAIRKFNQLIEDVAAQRLDRQEVMRRLKQLERRLSRGMEADREALADGLKELAKELEKSPATKPIAKALEEKDLDRAEKEMHELSERLRDKKDLSQADLDKLRKALEAASKANEDRLKRIEERRQELAQERKRLLKKKNQQEASPKDLQKLDQLKRQLERLTREKNRAQRAQRQMSQLDKELAEAARQLGEELSKSGAAKHLENGAEDIQRMAQRELSDKEKEQLKKKIQEMTELLRQQGQGGKEQLSRLLRFGQRARGQQGQGEDGKGGQRQGPGGQKPGQGPGEIKMGQGQGQGVPIPMGQKQGAGQGPGQSGGGEQKPAKPGGDQPGQGPGQPGQNWGTGHDENLKGKLSELEGQTQDVSAAGVDTGEGEASAEVIAGAAQRGFVGRGYKKVYTDYKTVAERALERDEIPPGYRFYVQRYFQLIRPRE